MIVFDAVQGAVATWYFQVVHTRSHQVATATRTASGDPKDPRADQIAGDVVTNGQVQANWGLHLIDANVAMGNLVDIVGQQAKAYLAKQKKN